MVYWRDIPAQVIVKKGRESAKCELAPRFAEAIDMAAMRAGASATDDYLADWRRGDPEPVSGDLQAAAESLRASLEEAWPQERLVAVARNKGRLPDD
ncbi:virulence factor [Pseudohoeflea coraliihabitans]|uniref:virulence factor n=1 Tax=Pseudohoeflea coraliihabitans TaxID=2860393 RepID=UPI003204A036